MFVLTARFYFLFADSLALNELKPEHYMTGVIAEEDATGLIQSCQSYTWGYQPPKPAEIRPPRIDHTLRGRLAQVPAELYDVMICHSL